MANLIFDYDGTIHNSMKTYAPAFRHAYKWLTDNGYVSPYVEYSDKEISYWLGFNSTDMWSQFQPDLAPEIREKARIMLGRDMAERVDRGEGELFPDTENVLQILKNQGHTLIFLSNCREHYLERHKRVFRLDRFFDFFYCCETFGFIPKYEIFRKIRPFHEGEFIVIGDRFHDIETALKNNLKSIGCIYGYCTDGELESADIKVKSISEIPCAVEMLINQKYGRT